MTDLPFQQIVAVDFEFSAPDGERPQVVCLVARELRTGQTWRYFQDELRGMSQPPYPIDAETLIVAYYASAEMGCHLALGWDLPVNVLDLFTEFRCSSNGLPLPAGGAGLLGALAWHGLDGLDAFEKTSMRQLALRGGEYTPEEQQALLAYCESDVHALERLLPLMLPRIDLPRALLRGRYMKAAATIEWQGVPIDTVSLAQLRAHWDDIQDQLIVAIDQAYGVFEGRTFKTQRFAEYLIGQAIPWPLLPSGALDLSDETFKDMARAYPQLCALRELRVALSQLRLSNLAVGKDGRNRCLLSAFRARTGRNQPSNAKFIFGPSTWLRGLIRPQPGWGIAYIDWGQQEFGIAAALSGDPLMQEAYWSGDPYLAFAKQARAVPLEATKDSHPKEREQFKACVLAVQYGMGEESLAMRIGQPVIRARELLRLHRETYRVFWHWSDAALDHAMLYGKLWTVFGWTIHVDDKPNPRSLRNFLMQGNGAELLRLACCLATERGIRVCAPVHDALLIEAPLEELEAAVQTTQAAMAEASHLVLDGFALRTDAKVIRYPERYSDPRGEAMWTQVWALIKRSGTALDLSTGGQGVLQP
jgi:DNA polymerase-1